MNYRTSLPIALLCLLLLGGCATSRSVLDISPPVTKGSAQPNGKEVLIGSVSDRRSFQASPSSPETPSLDPGEDQNDQIKLRSLGRKRNTFGKALGDIILKDGQTVESLTAASIRQAFVEKGYKVLDRKDQASGNTLFVDASVDKFWSWMNPGFASIALSTEISTALTIKSPGANTKKTVSVKASDNYQTGMEDNWIEVINRALRAYVDELKSKLD